MHPIMRKEFHYTENMLYLNLENMVNEEHKQEQVALTNEDKNFKIEIIKTLNSPRAQIDNYNNGKNFIRVVPSKTCLLQ
jgi:hypothetical protein